MKIRCCAILIGLLLMIAPAYAQDTATVTVSGTVLNANPERFGANVYPTPLVGEVYTQLNQPDYSAEIAQMMAAKPDGSRPMMGSLTLRLLVRPATWDFLCRRGWRRTT
mgnify:CR=1 FL=1